MLRTVTMVMVVAALVAVVGGTAFADRVGLTPVASDSPLSAHSGWVAWSELAPDGRWHLIAWHAGLRFVVPVAPRPGGPFDADVGTDIHGRVVVTYSRCVIDPGPLPTYSSVAGYSSPNGLPHPSMGQGCGLRAVDLASGRERVLHVDRPAGASDTTPSMWNGDVAFARRVRGAAVAQVMLWHHRTRKLTRLRHGAVPAACPYKTGCTAAPARGEVQQLDLGLGGVAFVWDAAAPGSEAPIDGWELRFDSFATGESHNYDRGYTSGACGARYPVSPTVLNHDVWFDELRWICDTPHTSYVHGNSAGNRSLLESSQPLLMWQAAVDGNTVYSIRGPAPDTYHDDPPCLASGAPCQLFAEPRPALPAIGRPVLGSAF
jgi:hypothetical protein